MEVQSGLTNSIIFLHGNKHQLRTHFGLLIANLQKSGEKMYEPNSHRQYKKTISFQKKHAASDFVRHLPSHPPYLCDLIWINVQIAIEVIIKLTPWWDEKCDPKSAYFLGVTMATRNHTCLHNWRLEKMVNSSESWMVHRVFHAFILAVLWNMMELSSLRAIRDHQTWRALLLMTRKYGKWIKFKHKK